MPKKDQYLNFYLGSIKELWLNYCKSLNKKPGSVLKEIAKQYLEKDKQAGSKVKDFKQKKENDGSSKKQRFEILLMPSEKAALELKAQQEGCSQRDWVIKLIRVGLTKEGQFNMPEMIALGESNYQLLSIGRNLNQIAKACNQGNEPQDTAATIIELNKIIKEHTKKVSLMVRASYERWDIG